jgi:hypothetical protein
MARFTKNNKPKYSVGAYLGDIGGYSYEVISQGNTKEELMSNAVVNKICSGGVIRKSYTVKNKAPFVLRAHKIIKEHVEMNLAMEARKQAQIISDRLWDGFAKYHKAVVRGYKNGKNPWSKP